MDKKNFGSHYCFKSSWASIYKLCTPGFIQFIPTEINKTNSWSWRSTEFFGLQCFIFILTWSLNFRTLSLQHQKNLCWMISTRCNMPWCTLSFHYGHFVFFVLGRDRWEMLGNKGREMQRRFLDKSEPTQIYTQAQDQQLEMNSSETYLCW